MMTRCQDHILTANIWFEWSKTFSQYIVKMLPMWDEQQLNKGRYYSLSCTQPMDPGWLREGCDFEFLKCECKCQLRLLNMRQ